jgi:hypothetical protein
MDKSRSSEQFGVRIGRELQRYLLAAQAIYNDASDDDLRDAAQTGAAVGGLASGTPGGMIAGSSDWLAEQAAKSGQSGIVLGNRIAQLLMINYCYTESIRSMFSLDQAAQLVHGELLAAGAKPLSFDAQWLPGARTYHDRYQLQPHHPIDPVLLAVRATGDNAGSVVTLSGISREGRFWKDKTLRKARHVVQALVAKLGPRLNETRCE